MIPIMTIPPIIPTSTGSAQGVPPKLQNVPPKIAQIRQPEPARSTPIPTSKWVHAMPERKSSTTPRRLTRRSWMAGFAILLVLGTGAFTACYMSSPGRSIRALAAAAGRHDREGVSDYLDAPAFAESLRKVALESVRRKIVKNKPEDFLDSGLNALADEVANHLVDFKYTSNSVISMVCGEEPTEAMKSGMANYGDGIMDALTKDGSVRAKLYGAAGKGLIRWVTGSLIDNATKNATTNMMVMNPHDYKVTTQYESFGRFLITITPQNVGRQSFGLSFKRDGIIRWKLSEIRVFPAEKKENQIASTQI